MRWDCTLAVSVCLLRDADCGSRPSEGAPGREALEKRTKEAERRTLAWAPSREPDVECLEVGELFTRHQ
jgi:hypothetical protein